MRQLLIALIILLSCAHLQAQRLMGRIADAQQQPLPFVAVFVEGTTQGTSSNAQGEYFLPLQAGTHRIVFRSMGFRMKVVEVAIEKADVRLDVQLEEDALALKEVVIKANAEDPAYDMIRSAQRMRRTYLNSSASYSCRVYIRGQQQIDEAPRKILGVDVNIPGSEGDSTLSGVVYLSESVSDFYYQPPNKKKEVMISSKVSGQNNAFSWNSALDFDVNFYRANLDLMPLSERPFISPIAPTAMLYYDYKFMGDYVEDGVLVNKIRVTPKRQGLPAFGGYLYLQDSTWRIHGVELGVSKKGNGVNFIDTLTFKQVYVPIAEGDWAIGTQHFNFVFSLKLFKIKGQGYYIGVFSNYKMNPALEGGFFGAELSRIEVGANKKDDAYWDGVRPIKLTEAEIADYRKKDSIAAVISSKSYKDSVDRISNKFKAINLLTGYSYRNSYKNQRFSFPSLLEGLQFNTVEGYVINADLGYYKAHEDNLNLWRLKQRLRYGTASKRLYFDAEVYRRFNATNRLWVSAEGGRYISQYNAQDPITPAINSAYSLLAEQNYMKLYEKSYASAMGSMEVVNGITLQGKANYEARRALANAPNVRPFKNWAGREYISNNPLDPASDALGFEPYRAFWVQLIASIQFRQQYYMRPNYKVRLESKWPKLYVQYRQGIPNVGNSQVDYKLLIVSSEIDLPLGLFGNASIIGTWGSFLSKRQLPFIDYRHFSTTQTIFSHPAANSYFLLPYYEYSSDGTFWELHAEHDFNGFIFKKLPLLKKLKWEELTGVHYLHTASTGHYLEWTVGIENIFRIIRADWVMSFGQRVPNSQGLRFRVGF